MKLPNWIHTLWQKGKMWLTEEPEHQKLRQLQWLVGRSQARQIPQFMDWLESLMLDYLRLAMAQKNIEYLKQANTVKFIFDEINAATDEQYRIQKENLEDQKKPTAG